MLKGRFGDTTHAPYIEGRVLFPSRQIAFDTSFLVDTGADQTVLMPADGLRAGLDYSTLNGSHPIAGIGGLVSVFEEPATIVFSVPRVGLQLYFLNLLVVPNAPQYQAMPSLLGRDILDRWRMHDCPIRNELEFEIINADHTVPLAPVGSKAT